MPLGSGMSDQAFARAIQDAGRAGIGCRPIFSHAYVLANRPEIAEAMGRASYAVRGFLAGLAKRGIKVEVLERVRQVGPNKTGAEGSYTIYRARPELAG
jgi:hypothetical protein